jgi:hypothetical protein
MKVFLSWSGEPSKSVADLLRRLLPCMLQGVDVFVSRHDLESGGRWSEQLARELENSAFGIVSLTAQNQSAPWLLFEAGALTKLSEGRACGLLLGGLTPANVAGPLAQFQHRRLVREEFSLLLRDINERLSAPLKDDQLRLVLEKWWPDLEAEYKEILARRPQEDPRSKGREDRDLLEEILERVRSLELGSERSVDQDSDQALYAVTRILRCLPEEELDFLLEASRMKSTGDHAGANELIALMPEVTASLKKKGFLMLRDGELKLNKFLRRVALRRLAEESEYPPRAQAR